MIRVGLTGNIAAGKTAVSDFWRSLGAPIIDADVLARRAVEPGSSALAAIEQEFGPKVITHGTLDRVALRELVFNDPVQRERLEAIVHPEVRRLRAQEEEQLTSRGARIVVHDIPLLYETGMQDEFDVVVVVDAPEHVRIRRIVESRGLNEAEARRMVDAQMPAHEKRRQATYVIDNDGTIDDLHAKAAHVWAQIGERAL